VLALSLLVITMGNTILNVGLPTIREELDASSSQLQWIVDSYLLVFAGLLLAAGSLGDRFGRKRALVSGLVVFGLGSVFAALSTDATTLIASRALMGLGAAGIMPATLSILTSSRRTSVPRRSPPGPQCRGSAPRSDRSPAAS
jgi:MFS family permease